jgi:hypothetical protein
MVAFPGHYFTKTLTRPEPFKLSLAVERIPPPASILFYDWLITLTLNDWAPIRLPRPTGGRSWGTGRFPPG